MPTSRPCSTCRATTPTRSARADGPAAPRASKNGGSRRSRRVFAEPRVASALVDAHRDPLEVALAEYQQRHHAVALGLRFLDLLHHLGRGSDLFLVDLDDDVASLEPLLGAGAARSEEHTSELQSLMRISYAVFCLKTKKT